MGNIIIQEETTLNPITLIGKEAGICYGTNTSDDIKNFKRGLDCLEHNHGRTMEYPQLYLVIDGYSARVIRELYTHIGGGPTRLQASTRYINYDNFSYIVPPSINTEDRQQIYKSAMEDIINNYSKLEALGVPKEDIANILPLGMKTKIVLRTNLRNLVDMSHQRLCSRAYWEFRNLMKDLKTALSEYSTEWKYICDNYLIPKCEYLGRCPEAKSCGRVKN